MESDGPSSSDLERYGSEFSDASLPDGQKKNGYSLEQIIWFLDTTEGKRNVNIEDFFPNLSVFLDSCKWLIKQRGPDVKIDTEVYRLKKLMQKVHSRMSDNTV